ncbi:Ig domain-containing protein [Paenibacillus sp. NPDC057967]|uniref:Ig-like domain-containing protein n=1 Tax=Paenibacillus sp. NPDC057967 TaxID=3346293 RepID=UPI0036D9397C
MRETSNSLSKQNSQQPKQFRGGEKKVMKKSLSLLVAIAMVFSMFAAVASAAEKQTAGEYLQEIGVIKGNLEGNLNEDKEWKREDLTVLLSRLLGVEKAASEHANTHGFTDVTNSFYDGFISWAKKEGLMIGKTETTFGYNAPLTNQHFAAVVLRALKIEADYDDVPKVAVEKKLVAEGTDFAANALRGATYEVIVTALNTEVTGTGKKLGTILGLKGFEVKELTLDSVIAPSRATVVLDFNTEVGAAKATNFTVHEKGNQYAIKVIDKVAVEGDKVTLTLIDTLTNDKEYVVEVNGLKTKAGDYTLDLTSKDFKYVAQAAASIGFARTTVAKGSDVPVVIKDANGNDITANYSIPGDLTIETSDTTKVASDLEAVNVGYAVVNVKLNNTDFETGNTIINVKETLSQVTSFGKVGIGNIDDQKLDIFAGDTGVLSFQVLDQSNNVVDAGQYTASFRSLNPTVVVVDQAGLVTPVSAGTATVVLTADGGDDKKISKSVTITVKAAAKATSIKVEAANSKLVIGSAIAQTVKFEVLDQYGNTFKPTSPEVTEITYSINRDKLADGVAKDVVQTVGIVDGKADIVLNPYSASDAEALSGSLKVKYGSMERTISVSLVKAGNFAGYAAVAGDTALDLNVDTADKKRKGPTNTTITVYEKDVNGNYISVVNSGVTLEDADATGGAVSVAGQTVTSAKVGSENVVVKVNSARVATIGFTVVNTTPALSTVAQNNNAVTVKAGDSLTTKLFGTDADGGVFVGYNQYGDKVQIIPTLDATKVQVISSDLTVVDNDLSIGVKGEATLTLKIADKHYIIVVKVVD